MTQQYIVGEFSCLLADLRPAPNDRLTHAVDELRHEIETGPLQGLPGLAREAMRLTDLICWAALEQGNPSGFRRYAGTAAILREFSDCSGLTSSNEGR